MITSNYSCFTAWYIFLSCNRGYLTQPIQGSNKPQCFLVTAIIKLFWYPIHVERTVRNVNNKIVIQCREHSRKLLEYYNACFCTSVKIASCFGFFFTLQDKYYMYMHKLSVKIKFTYSCYQ